MISSFAAGLPRRRGLLLLSCCGLSFAHRLGHSVRRPTAPRLAAAFCTASDSTLSTNPCFDLSLPCRSLAFYLISEVAEPDEAVRRHREFLDERSMVGRVYICSSGMNAQACPSERAPSQRRGLGLGIAAQATRFPLPRARPGEWHHRRVFGLPPFRLG